MEQLTELTAAAESRARELAAVPATLEAKRRAMRQEHDRRMEALAAADQEQRDAVASLRTSIEEAQREIEEVSV